MRHRITSFRCVIAPSIGSNCAKIKPCIAFQFRQSSMLRAASGDAGKTSRDAPANDDEPPAAEGDGVEHRIGGRDRRHRRRSCAPTGRCRSSARHGAASAPPQRHPPRDAVAADRRRPCRSAPRSRWCWRHSSIAPASAARCGSVSNKAGASCAASGDASAARLSNIVRIIPACRPWPGARRVRPSTWRFRSRRHRLAPSRSPPSGSASARHRRTSPCCAWQGRRTSCC